MSIRTIGDLSNDVSSATSMINEELAKLSLKYPELDFSIVELNVIREHGDSKFKQVKVKADFRRQK